MHCYLDGPVLGNIVLLICVLFTFCHRTISEGFKINNQDHLVPVLGTLVKVI
jgi:hypothetical protein